MSKSVAISVVSLGGWRKGRGGRVQYFRHERDFCQAQKGENPDPRTNYAVKYATARGHLSQDDRKGGLGQKHLTKAPNYTK